MEGQKIQKAVDANLEDSCHWATSKEGGQATPYFNRQMPSLLQRDPKSVILIAYDGLPLRALNPCTVIKEGTVHIPLIPRYVSYIVLQKHNISYIVLQKQRKCQRSRLGRHVPDLMPLNQSYKGVDAILVAQGLNERHPLWLE